MIGHDGWLGLRRLGVLAAVAVVLMGAACTSSTSDQGAPERLDKTKTLAGGILRVVIGGQRFDLMLWRVRPDYSSGPPPRCIRTLGRARYTLNWSSADEQHAVPKITLGLAAVDGTPMTLWMGSGNGCSVATNLSMDGMAADTQFTTGGALPRSEPAVDRLRVTIDDRTATVPLRPTCTDAQLAQDYADRKAPCSDDPMNFDMRNGYSARLNIS